MKLTITTPLAVVAEVSDVTHLRGEDTTGSFGILPGHADFLTALDISVLSWHGPDGRERHAAVDGGMLEVRAGTTISVATREAVLGDDLRVLEANVVTRFRRQFTEEQVARQDTHRLYLAAMRQIYRFLRSGASNGAPGGQALGWPDWLEQ